MSLVAWYHLNEDAGDRSGNSRHGTVSGATLVAPGKLNKCYRFDGVNDSIALPVSSSMMSNMTVSFWIYNRNAGSTGIMGSAGAMRTINFFRYPTLNDFHWSMGGDTQGVVAGMLPFDKWTHVTFSIEEMSLGSYLYKIYMNGEYIISDQGTGRYILTDTIKLGVCDSTAFGAFDLNDVRFYDNVLSDKEIYEIYQTKILHYAFNVPEEEVSNLANSGIKPAYSPWGTNAGSATTFTAPDGSTGVVVDVTSFTSGGMKYFETQTLEFPVVGGEPYTISATVKYEGMASLSPNVLYVKQFNYVPAIVSENGRYSPTTQESLGGGWYRIWSTFWPVGSASSIRVEGYTYSTGKIWICDLQLESKDHHSVHTGYSRESIIRDSSMNSNDGVLSPLLSPDLLTGGLNVGDSLQWTEDPLVGGCYSFYPMSENHIRVVDSAKVKPTDEVTVAIWAYRTHWQGTDIEKMISCTEGGGWQIGLNDTTGYVNFSVYASGYGYANATYPKTSLTAGWHHFAGTFNGTVATFFVDGVAVGDDDLGDSPYPGAKWDIQYHATNSIFIGAEAKGDDAPAGLFFRGKLGDARVYATALTQAEILALVQRKASLDKNGNLRAKKFVEYTNLAANGNFEIGSIGSLPDGWVVEVSGGANLTNDGSRKCMYFPGDGVYRRIKSLPFKVNPGELIHGRCSMKSSAGVSFYLGIQYDVGGYQYFYSSSSASPWTTTPPGSVVVPDGATEGSVWVFNYSGNTGDLWVDDVFVSRNPIPDGFELMMTNGMNIVQPVNKASLNGNMYLSEISEVGPVDELVAYFPLVKTTEDYSGNKHSFSLQAESLVDSNGLKLIYANPDYSLVNITSGLNQNEITVSAWVKIDNAAVSNNIISRNGPIFLRVTSSTVRFCIYSNSSWTFANGSTPIPSGQWVHLVGTYDGSYMRAYVNGVKDLEVAKTGTMSSSTLGEYKIGYTTGGEDAPFGGNIQDLRFYSRALTDSEVYSLYSVGVGSEKLLQMGTNQTFIKGEIIEV